MEFKIRPWQPNDADSLAKYANNYNIAKNLRNVFPHPYTLNDAKNFIEFANNDKPIHIFAIDVNGEAVGGIGLHPMTDVHMKNAELGYWLAEPFWGKGIISKAIMEIVHFGFKTYDIDRIFAIPFGTNYGSQKALEKAGFKLEGRFEKTIFKNGEYFDELIYAVRKENLGVF